MTQMRERRSVALDLAESISCALASEGVAGRVTGMEIDTQIESAPLMSATGGSVPVDRIVTGLTSMLTIKVALDSITLRSGRKAPVTRGFLELPIGRAIDLVSDAI